MSHFDFLHLYEIVKTIYFHEWSKFKFNFANFRSIYEKQTFSSMDVNFVTIFYVFLSSAMSKRLLVAIDAETKKGHPSHDTLKALLDQDFTERSKWVATVPSLKRDEAILERYPCFKLHEHVCSIFSDLLSIDKLEFHIHFNGSY